MTEQKTPHPALSQWERDKETRVRVAEPKGAAMRGVVFVGGRQIDMREVVKPVPGPGEVVLAMKASGLCGSDLRPYRTPKPQRGDPSTLTVGGHEPCGVVALRASTGAFI
jgi:D-arabinose 1-dehydrogenase-like Zn-dependent alcohol dehydrogenase